MKVRPQAPVPLIFHHYSCVPKPHPQKRLFLNGSCKQSKDILLSSLSHKSIRCNQKDRISYQKGRNDYHLHPAMDFTLCPPISEKAAGDRCHSGIQQCHRVEEQQDQVLPLLSLISTFLHSNTLLKASERTLLRKSGASYSFQKTASFGQRA